MTTISPERMHAYREGARRRHAQQKHQIDVRRRRAWVVARETAKLLRTKYGATQVFVFGSLAHGHWFGSRSDIDVAAVGIAPEAYWQAWRDLDQIDHSLKIDLIALESAPDSLRRQIAEEGVEL
ncbi:MAG: nucleotidyltransferase domain-containing protein [Anaerolineae bacterium]|nr:MAG: nucleotidyltransferase domain-containing protein [Anaerolineae bacterium]